MSTHTYTAHRRARFPTVPAMAAACLVALIGAPALLAQDQAAPRDTAEPAMGPPPILAIFTEQVKVGMEASHAKLEERFADVYSQFAWAKPYIAMTSISGQPEAWFFSPLNSMDEFEKMIKGWEQTPERDRSKLENLVQQETEHLDSTRVKLAFYRPGLSFNPTSELPRKRYMSVMSFQVRPGHARQFEEAAELVRTTYQKAGSEDNYAVFQVLTGAPDGTYLVFSPMEALAEFGPDQRKQKAFYDALGESEPRLRQLISESLLSSETTLFAFNPGMSNAPPQFAEIDPFWRADREAVGTTGKEERERKDQRKER
jgi:hypothetical protein